MDRNKKKNIWIVIVLFSQTLSRKKGIPVEVKNYENTILKDLFYLFMHLHSFQLKWLKYHNFNCFDHLKNVGNVMMAAIKYWKMVLRSLCNYAVDELIEKITRKPIFIVLIGGCISFQLNWPCQSNRFYDSFFPQILAGQ